MNIKFNILSILPFNGLDKYKDKSIVRVKNLCFIKEI